MEIIAILIVFSLALAVTSKYFWRAPSGKTSQSSAQMANEAQQRPDRAVLIYDGFGRPPLQRGQYYVYARQKTFRGFCMGIPYPHWRFLK